jgi:FkbM family methyltransferase
MLITGSLTNKFMLPWRFFNKCGLSPIDWLRLRKFPRYKGGRVLLWGINFEFVDVPSLFAGLKEIYLEQCYQFKADSDSPLIIDCGANIGLSVFYFKNLYPNARVIAFEADPIIFSVLKRNVKSAGLRGVELINKAAWDSDQTLEFRSEGGYSGRIAIAKEDGRLFSIKGARLKEYFDKQVDFLKIDIEGAEGRVIKDCADKLINVARIFLEYHSHHRESQKLAEILEFLRSSGFRYYIKEAYVPNAPFISCPTHDGMDLQLNIYAVRYVQSCYFCVQ